MVTILSQCLHIQGVTFLKPSERTLFAHKNWVYFSCNRKWFCLYYLGGLSEFNILITVNTIHCGYCFQRCLFDNESNCFCWVVLLLILGSCACFLCTKYTLYHTWIIWNQRLFSWYSWQYMQACVLSRFSCVRLFATPWTVAHQGPLSMGFSRQEYWSG